jgi:cytoskeletal protein CcmA (bactofilin family)
MTTRTLDQPRTTAGLQTGIGRGLRIKGQLMATENLLIDGVFEGSIDLQHHELTTSANSEVNALVTARTVTVYGRFDGHISAEVVDIAEGATVDANVLTRTFALEEGARFNGAVNTERARAAGEIARRKLSQAPGGTGGQEKAQERQEIRRSGGQGDKDQKQQEIKRPGD